MWSTVVTKIRAIISVEVKLKLWKCNLIWICVDPIQICYCMILGCWLVMNSRVESWCCLAALVDKMKTWVRSIYQNDSKSEIKMVVIILKKKLIVLLNIRSVLNIRYCAVVTGLARAKIALSTGEVKDLKSKGVKRLGVYDLWTNLLVCCVNYSKM